MKRSAVIISATAAALIAAAFTFNGNAQKKYGYLGIGECRKCHATDTIGNQFRAWDANPHSMAYRNLKTEKALAIAAKRGIKIPSESAECLKCHTTGGGTDPKTAAEGVGCEACHGPAEGYGELSNHGALGDKQKDYERAASFGMYRILGYDGIKLRERMCKRCHTADRPCVPENIDERKKQELSLSAIADFVFRHPLR
jgi:hypothetical protein